MNRLWKRLLSWLLIVLLVAGLMPAATAAVAEDALTEQDYAQAQQVFDQIDAMEAQPSKRGTSQSQRTDAAQALVEASESYVGGSLERNGDAFTWLTEEGIRCSYNPRMRRIREEMTAPETPVEKTPARRSSQPTGPQVYVIGPYYGIDSNFSNQYRNEAADIAAALGDSDGYTLYAGEEATIDNVAEAMSQGAVVIFDSHGTTDYMNPDDCYDYVTGATTSYLCLTSTAGLTAEDYSDGAAWNGSEVFVNGKVIANHMNGQNPGGILWMAICYGMATDSFCTSMRAQGVEVVYGYSQSVTFDGDYFWEEIFWDAMMEGATVADAVAEMKEYCGHWDYCAEMYDYAGWISDGYGPFATIMEAREEYCAFPVVVSDQDPYPGKRTIYSYGVDDYQTVYSSYTLFPQYAITALSSNSEWGTVAVEGETVIPEPAPGYYAASCTVVSGMATVSREFDNFIVQPQSDCTVQVEFARKIPVTVNLYGISEDRYLSGEYMILPELEATEGYTYYGWTRTPLAEDTTEAPETYRWIYFMTDSCTLYPVYTYQQQDEGMTVTWYSTLGIQAPDGETPEKPIELIQWAGSNVTLGGALALNFALDASQLNGTTGNYVILTRTYADGTTDTVKVPQSQWVSAGGSYIKVTYYDLAAKEMGDKITAVVYNADGKAISETRTDSIAEYSARMLVRADIASSAKKRTLFVDMLNYGAAAQAFFVYDAEHLVNADLTEEQAGFASEAVEIADHRQGSGCYFGSNLKLEREIYLQLAFQAAYSEDLYAIASFTDHYGHVTEQKLTVTKNGSYVIVRVDGMAIADYRALVTCTLYSADGTELGCVIDSMESYVARKADSLNRNGADLGDAIMKLGAASYAYFHSSEKT